MGSDHWIVHNRAGEEWGLIRRLILDLVTRQINFADVVVIQTGHVARIPWDGFEIRPEGITLGMSEAQVKIGSANISTAMAEQGVAMDVGP
ncbi:MAG: hypothetical protein KA240_06190 [Nitrospira sp.]|jgi:hypothetical protein|nr:hypothetical protein [Nitrospira sp.]MBP6605255.1 hypothetical protein [Nitrospira sp.]MCI1279240.1 hypothetical protein [Nitrospira sp.]HQY58784.1 hypothetical protein [Nitrospira sp.]HRA95333.1 hypothetical protein [Nitrospira sp.]